MNQKEYIGKIVKYIRGKHRRTDAARELAAHFEDRKQYYSDAGFDAETAEQKAITRMGDAEVIGTRMNKVHASSFFALMLAILIVLSAVAIYCNFFVGTILYSERLKYTLLRLENFSALLLFIFGFLGLKYRYKSIYILSHIPYLFFVMFQIAALPSIIRLTGVSGIVWESIYLLSGRIEEMRTVSTCFMEVEAAPWLLTASALFYVFTFVSLITGIVLMIKETHFHITLRQKQMLRRLKRSFLLIAIGLFAITAVYESVMATGDKEARWHYYENVYVKVTDQCESGAEGVALLYNADDGIYEYTTKLRAVSDSACVLTGTGANGEIKYHKQKCRYDNNISYYIYVFEVSVKTDKKYICFSDSADMQTAQSEQWKAANKGETYRVPLDRSEYPSCYVIFCVE